MNPQRLNLPRALLDWGRVRVCLVEPHELGPKESGGRNFAEYDYGCERIDIADNLPGNVTWTGLWHEWLHRAYARAQLSRSIRKILLDKESPLAEAVRENMDYVEKFLLPDIEETMIEALDGLLYQMLKRTFSIGPGK